jgi:hypothetical protein
MGSTGPDDCALRVLDEVCIALVFLPADKIIIEIYSSYLDQQPASCLSSFEIVMGLRHLFK